MKITFKFSIYFGVPKDLVAAAITDAEGISGESNGRTTRHCYRKPDGAVWEHTVRTYGFITIGSLRRVS